MAKIENDGRGDYWQLGDEGDILDGQLEEVDFVTWEGEDGREIEVPLLTVANNHGRAPFWGFTTVIRRKLLRLKPQPGERVRITRGPKRTNRKGKPYYEDRLECPDRPRSSVVDWAAGMAGVNAEPTPVLTPGANTTTEQLPMVAGTATETTPDVNGAKEALEQAKSPAPPSPKPELTADDPIPF